VWSPPTLRGQFGHRSSLVDTSCVHRVLASGARGSARRPTRRARFTHGSWLFVSEVRRPSADRSRRHLDGARSASQGSISLTDRVRIERLSDAKIWAAKGARRTA